MTNFPPNQHSELPDDSIVIRGGSSSPNNLERSLATYEVGVEGVAVFAATETSFHELCKSVPHKRVRCTTVGTIRKAGGDVIRTTQGSAEQAMLVGIRALEAANESIHGLRSASTPQQPSSRVTGAGPSPPKVFADFNNADQYGRVRLNTRGTQQDLRSQDIQLKDGVLLTLDDDDEIRTVGTVRWDDRNGWVAEVDWTSI